jgi:PAS domain S-box-containing protein/putative nucleotidyltransferase with HDIG domain
MPVTKIMIVEDEAIVARDIQKSVEAMGHLVCAVASSGEEAIQKADETRPDLVLMDIVLKGAMDGVEAAGQVGARFKIPVVYLTAFDDDEILQRAKRTAPYAYITKPFNDRELHIAIEVALYKHQAEAKIRRTEHWLAAVLRSVGDAVIASDKEGRITFMNPMAEKLTGWKQEDAFGKKMTEVLNIREEELENLERHLVEKVITEGLIINLLEDHLLIAKDGTQTPISDSVAPIRSDDGEIPGTVLVFRDITEHKRAEAALRGSEERFRTVFERSTIGNSLTAPDGKLLQVNQAFSDMLGYTIEEMQKLNFAGITHPDDIPKGQECIRSLLADERTADRFEKRYIHKSGDIVWADLSAMLLRDEQGTPLYLITSIVNITERKRAEEQLRETLESLRRAVGATIKVMAATVETRDPYTAGHQIRSADLARAIAAEMGLPQDKIDAIRMAGSIHDIGKISTPAEILSKPTKLSDLEFSLIKEHARQGYEILKDVESPWPLAEIVRQHHERMDGSGYPRGLRGEAIMVEARILAVADVVESMASHRPYRAALGLNAALEEIEKNRETLYDADVAAACLRLFREKGYQLQKA